MYRRPVTAHLSTETSELPLGVSGPPEHRTALFRDPEVEAELAETGLVELEVVTPDDVAELIAGYWDIAPPDDDGLAIDFMRTDRELVRRLSDLVRRIVERRLADVLLDHQIVMSTFVVKHPGWASDMFLHDDRTFVDERRHRCVTLWTPLTDVGPDIPNGGLQVVPGSHRLARTWAGSSTPEPFRFYERSLRDLAECRSLPAGRSIAYDTRVLHSSGPNLTGEPRLAAVVAVAPAAAQLIHVVATGHRRRAVHEVDAAFYTDHHPRDVERRMPPGYPESTWYDAEPALSDADVVRLVGRPVERRVDGLVPYDMRRADDPPSLGDLGIERGRFDSGAGVGSSERPTGLRPSGPVGRDVLVVPPGDRREVVLRSRWGVAPSIRVLAAPEVGAGARSGTAARVLEPGTIVEIGPSAGITLWNDGPGDLVIVIEHTVFGIRRAWAAARRSGGKWSRIGGSRR